MCDSNRHWLVVLYHNMMKARYIYDYLSIHLWINRYIDIHIFIYIYIKIYIEKSSQASGKSVLQVFNSVYKLHSVGVSMF